MFMRSRAVLAVSFTIGALLHGCGRQEAAPAADTTTVAQSVPTPANVPVIDSIHCAINKSNPPELVVTAFGNVPTGGWTNEKLSPRVYTSPPADGIWDYDFVALPPSGPAIQVITPVSATHNWPSYPANDLKGVRIHGVGAGVKASTLPECNKP